MNSDLTKQVKQLHTLDKSSLRALWRQLFGRTAADDLRREVMLPILAYRLQEKAFGGLRTRTRNALQKASEELSANPKSRTSLRPKFKPGTYLVREWQGKTHRVTATARGFEHDGMTFSSLSHVARHITGSRWSGPLFFGLRRAAKGGEEPDA